MHRDALMTTIDLNCIILTGVAALDGAVHLCRKRTVHIVSYLRLDACFSLPRYLVCLDVYIFALNCKLEIDIGLSGEGSKTYTDRMRCEICASGCKCV